MNRSRGFTLIELLIVIAILGILAGIAWPSYLEHVRSSHRTSAQSALMGLAQALEQHYTENGSYSGAADDNGVPTIFPSEAPLDNNSKTYNLTVNATSSTYTLTATPKNSQQGDGVIVLFSSGLKAWDRDDDGTISSPDEECWGKTCS
ncbi:type IV pilin protein [Microbulbifer sp. JMSA003]|uniref:type IV pilin protein n=1 Tax=Microbulbifer sp. JMSA003 TaxID=3243369 RepID=UPI00403A77C7